VSHKQEPPGIEESGEEEHKMGTKKEGEGREMWGNKEEKP